MTTTDAPAGSPSSLHIVERLRQSLDSQRAFSPSHERRASSDSSHRKKLTLEERLKASLAIVEKPVATTPSASENVLPIVNPISPTSHPLPDSPALSTHSPQKSKVTGNSDTNPQDPLQIEELDISNGSENSPHESPQITPRRVEPATQSIEHSGIDSGVTDVDALRERLKLMEQRFSEVSESFKRLQAEKLQADGILRELTPLESCSNSEALRNYLQNAKQESAEEKEGLALLSAKLLAQESRLEELRDTHRMEESSQSDQIESLRNRLQEADALAQAASSMSEAESAHKAEIERLTTDIGKAQEKAKMEEEKRVKAVTLLKTVRQKLVKAEKDKEEAVKEHAAVKEKESQDHSRFQEQKSRLERELETSHIDRDRAINGLKSQFDKEVVALRDRHEKEISALRSQFELDVVANKNLHSKELSVKNSRIKSLEELVNSLTTDKNLHFEELQEQQASYESSQTHLETLQAENADLRFRLRDSADRIAALNDEVIDMQRSKEDPSRSMASSATDVARLLAEAESKYEYKLSELRRNLAATEKERSETEAQWSRRHREKVQENEELRRTLGSADKSREHDEETATRLQADVQRLTSDCQVYQRQIADLTQEIDKMVELQASMLSSESEHHTKFVALEKFIEEGKQRESALRNEKKNLKDELRKVQSSAALLEKQRNPGVGYWVGRNDNGRNDSRHSISSSTDDISRTPGTPPPSSQSDEEVNLEYLRNVILQFLEHKEMRPSLVKVLSIILHFTPQETRRLIAKV